MTIALHPEPESTEYSAYRRYLSADLARAEDCAERADTPAEREAFRAVAAILGRVMYLKPSVATRAAFTPLERLKETPGATADVRALVEAVRDDLSFFARISP